MSDEEEVALFETALDAILYEVTPRRGKGALGAWWISLAVSERDSEPTNPMVVGMSSGGVYLWRKGCMWASA